MDDFILMLSKKKSKLNNWNKSSSQSAHIVHAIYLKPYTSHAINCEKQIVKHHFRAKHDVAEPSFTRQAEILIQKLLSFPVRN